MSQRTILPALLAFPAFLSSAFAADTTSEVEGLKLGEHWYGPKLEVGDLKGRVVLVEFWGRN